MTPYTPEKKPSPTFVRAQPEHAGCCGDARVCSPTHHEIERRAYEIYVAHGRSEGRRDEDWRQAEHQLAAFDGVVPTTAAATNV